MNKKQLYESIMRNVSREVKKVLNEDLNVKYAMKQLDKDQKNLQLQGLKRDYLNKNFAENQKYFNAVVGTCCPGKDCSGNGYAITYGYIELTIFRIVIKTVKYVNKTIYDIARKTEAERKTYYYEVGSQWFFDIDCNTQRPIRCTWINGNGLYVKPYITNKEAAEYVAFLLKKNVLDKNNKLCDPSYYTSNFIQCKQYDDDPKEKGMACMTTEWEASIRKSYTPEQWAKKQALLKKDALLKKNAVCENSKKLYKIYENAVRVGDKIRIIKMDDDCGKDISATNMAGKEGIVKHIDSNGQLHGTWGSLAIIPEIDEYKVFKWCVEDFDDEADENGLIHVNIGEFTEGGRESLTSKWSVEMLEESESYWVVKAICIESELRRFDVGDEITFNLYKDTAIYDLSDALLDALENENF
ncbi:MAG: hypothetical protein [Wendovervirus sonii]|uniref:Uncharacterized protein n=1 Tax=phage Lak_Megaphage_Sonny TaxID=3109229 RepID=A0ABZ0Z3W3_9CAUD|nr:MAG: hypothetical protein [phage Lak_Megaphage_Sonny]